MPSQLKVVEKPQTRAESEVVRLRLLTRAVQAERDERMQPPVDRLREIIAEAEELGREADSLQRDFDAEMDRWIAAPSGEQPEPSPDLLACRQRYLAAETRRAAAQRQLPAAMAEVEAANQWLAQLSQQRDQALTALAVERLSRFLDGPFSRALAVALAAEARAISLERVLWDRGAGSTAAALVAKARARHGVSYNVHSLNDRDAQLAGQAYEAARTRHAVDEAAARKFINELLADPTMEIE